jgi:hypothetical protein
METVFDKLTYRQIKTLMDVIRSTKGQDYEFISKKYKSNEENFERALDFLKGLKLLRANNDKITPTRDLMKLLNCKVSDDNLTKSYLLEKTLNSMNLFSKEVFEYLNNFRVSRNIFEYKPTTKKRLKESGIRNLFVELDLIQYDKISKSYKITDKNFTIFANYVKEKKLTPKELSYLLKKQEELGKEAEFTILEYEKKRLAYYPHLLEQLEHISKFDVKAGFDIKSCETELDNEKAIPRYIEVKAVSKFNFKINWTRNEIEKSKLYSKQYYLYLLPVISDKKFDIKGLEIIQNPYEKVFKNNTEWKKQVEQYILWKKKQR